MPVYKYEAITSKGGDWSGEITATDETAAVTKLNEYGLTVYELNKCADGYEKKAKPDEMSIFLSQLSAVEEAGKLISLIATDSIN